MYSRKMSLMKKIFVKLIWLYMKIVIKGNKIGHHKKNKGVWGCVYALTYDNCCIFAHQTLQHPCCLIIFPKGIITYIHLYHVVCKPFLHWLFVCMLLELPWVTLELTSWGGEDLKCKRSEIVWDIFPWRSVLTPQQCVSPPPPPRASSPSELIWLSGIVSVVDKRKERGIESELVRTEPVSGGTPSARIYETIYEIEKSKRVTTNMCCS